MFPAFSYRLLFVCGLWLFGTHACVTHAGSPIPRSDPQNSPNFEIDVQVVLSKAGCNAGTCHGNQNGKGGFKLSLRGQDPDFDYYALVGQNAGRRVNRLEPSKSMLLTKPTMELAHQGGKRFDRADELYRRLRDWIAAGAPGPTGEAKVERLLVRPTESICFAPVDQVRINAEALFANGSRRDVSAFAVYETSNLNVSVSPDGIVTRNANGEATVIVRYLDQQVPVRIAFLDERKDFRWDHREPRNYVDQYLFAKLKKFRANPTERCSDHVFLRRASLDLIGRTPSEEVAREFIADADPHKRDRLIETLLASPEFADNWSLKWADLLRVEENVLDRRGVDVFHGWIRQSIADDKPLDEFVSELLLARGSTYDNPPANYFRALRQTNARGEAAARVFLGTRLQCAQCHNHPFDRWTQDDYYSWASLFARVDYEIVENKRKDRLDKKQFVGEQLVKLKDEGEVTNPGTGQTVQPRFLGELASVSKDEERLAALATWLTSSENRQFARSQVNRIWFHLMGRGLVNPVDDFRTTNPATHPELLERLTDELIDSGFRIRPLIRTIMQSESYQLQADSSADPQSYAHVSPRRLTAEQLLDAQATALATATKFNGHDFGVRASQLPGVHKVRGPR